MQRVAIARALVNNPDIILADEPTGALDTETSVQVMELLKEVAKDRLVIMVTHNPDLAEQYSTRIIRMLDGNLLSDTNPLSEEELLFLSAQVKPIDKKKRREKKPSMRFSTAFGLSLKNLFTKKGRTTLTAFAGSIGIIGIALIYAVSNGMTAYINAVQEDTLASYPLTLEATTVDLGTLMETFMGTASKEDAHEKDAVYSQAVLFEMINALNNIETNENDLRSFKAYLQQKMKDPESTLQEALTGVQYTYDPELLVYTKNIDGSIIWSDTEELLMDSIAENMGMDMSAMMEMQNSSPLGSMMSSSSSMMMGAPPLWCEMLPEKDGSPINEVLKNQYDVIYGSWPNDYNEIVIILDENNEIDDMTLYALGLRSKEEIDAVFKAVDDGSELDATQKKWTYKEICEMVFRVVPGHKCYSLDKATGLWTDLRETDAGLRYIYDNGIDLKITGILRPNEEATSAMLQGSIGYTSKLTEYLIKGSKDAEVVKAQLENPETDIFTGLPFEANTGNLTNEEKDQAFRDYIKDLSNEEKAELYIKIMSIPDPEQLEANVNQALGAMDRPKMEETLIAALIGQMGMNEAEVKKYITEMSEEDLKELMREMISEQIKRQTATEVTAKLSPLPVAQRVAALEMAMKEFTAEDCALYYDEVLVFSESSYEQNLIELNYVDLEDPATINLYASSFENKDIIEEVIAEYNESVDELKRIRYTDYIGIMMSSITTIINAITYVLIAFVAISLVVSSIMIGVITLISVQERTKEIGILRAIGASKKNVSGMFNAETMIIGFASGLLGVGVTYLLCIPINAIIYALTDIPALKAALPVNVGIVLVLISVLLTLISGIIPSRSAAKKDPVVALRTE